VELPLENALKNRSVRRDAPVQRGLDLGGFFARNALGRQS
jgi:hypothetical protein